LSPKKGDRDRITEALQLLVRETRKWRTEQETKTLSPKRKKAEKVG
jgi:hypothetical protein